MNLYRETTWKWWELKLIVWGGLLLGLALGSYYGKYLMEWLWLIWLALVVIWLYVIVVYFKK